MKKILLIITLFASLVGCTQVTNDFNIIGNIKNADSCNYTLYDVDDNGKWRYVKQVFVDDSRYNITLVPHRNYLAIFETTNAVKHMYFNIDDPDGLTMDLDFDDKTHFVFYYDFSKHKYDYYLVEDSDLLRMRDEE